MALWLREKGVDLKLIELHPFKDGDELYLEPMVIIPPPSTEKWERVGGRPVEEDKPWLLDGPGWHRKRAGELGFERAQTLIAKLKEAKLVQNLTYTQKHYIAVRDRKSIWLYVRPRPNQLRIETRRFDGEFDLEAWAERLGFVVHETKMELKEKLALPSSITIYERRGSRRIILRIKHDYDLDSEALLEFLRALARGKLQ